MQEPYKQKLKINIKKAKWLLDTIEKMIENDRYCLDIAQQVNASIWILKSSKDLILESHLNSCASHKLASKDENEKEQFINELMTVFHISKKK